MSCCLSTSSLGSRPLLKSNGFSTEQTLQAAQQLDTLRKKTDEAIAVYFSTCKDLWAELVAVGSGCHYSI